MATIYDIKGNILFQDDNLSFKELVEKNKFNLIGANLIGANLFGSNLEGADLSGAYLSGANLSGSILTGSILTGSILTDANLSNVFLPISSKWNISYMLNSKDFETSDISKIIIKIGCKEKTIQEWDNWFNSDEEFQTKRGTEEFKQIYANYVAVREFLKIMVKGEY